MSINWDQYINPDRLQKSKRVTAGDPRNEFESDFGRVIFSPAMRRMHDKTQVFPLTTDDHIHSRLTHTLEVMAIGYSLGIRLGQEQGFQSFTGRNEFQSLREVPILLKNACLVHDIGNPPFGHFGEEVIKQYFIKKFTNRKFDLSPLHEEDFKLFDGNAQGFRVLTKLQVLDNAFGLNLTYGTLGTFLKYPNADNINGSILALSKRGVFQSERNYLDEIVTGCKLNNGKTPFRHPLAFLMEGADSICYLVMDIEDGFNKGWYDYGYIKDALAHIEGLKQFFDALENEKIEHGEEMTRVVRTRIHLMSRLVKLAVDNFVKNLPDICTGTYNNELIKDDMTGLQKALNQICIDKIFPNREIQSLELTGHSILTGLLDYYIDFIFDSSKHYLKRAQGMISSGILRAAFIENNLPDKSKIDELNDYFKLRIIVDYIAGMTDQFALNHYQKLSGQKII